MRIKGAMQQAVCWLLPAVVAFGLLALMGAFFGRTASVQSVAVENGISGSRMFPLPYSRSPAGGIFIPAGCMLRRTLFLGQQERKQL